MKKLYFLSLFVAFATIASWAETQKSVTLPEGLEPEQWILLADGEGRSVNVAIDGDKFYLGNLSDYVPDEYVVGKIADDKVVFPLTYLAWCDELDSDLYFIPATFDTRYVEEYDMDVEDYFVVEEFQFSYDAEKKHLSNIEEYAACFVGCDPEVGALAPGWAEYFFEPEIMWMDSALENAPLLNPEFTYALYDEYYECDEIDFWIPLTNSESYPLDAERLSYIFYIDNAPFTFTPDEYFIDEDMTEVPFNFVEEDYLIWSVGSAHAVCIYPKGPYKTVGLKVFYELPDGTRIESDYVEADIYELSGGECGAVGSVTDDRTPIATTYYDLTGRKVTNPAAGIVIKVDTFSNGTTRATKSLIK